MIEYSNSVTCKLDDRRVHLRERTWANAAPQILDLRAARAAELGLSDDADEAALHVTAETGGFLVAAIRAQFADHGRLDFEPLLPQPIPRASRNEVVSISRFVLDGAFSGQLRPLLTALITEVFRLSWRRGYRIALFTATERLAPIYARLLSADIVTAASSHPRTGRGVQVLAFAPLTWPADHPMGRQILRPGDSMAPETAGFLAALLAGGATQTSRHRRAAQAAA